MNDEKINVNENDLYKVSGGGSGSSTFSRMSTPELIQILRKLKRNPRKNAEKIRIIESILSQRPDYNPNDN